MNVLFWRNGRKTAVVHLLLLFAALLLTMPITASANDAAEKMRAAFSGIGAAEDDERRMRLLKEHGFNTALICDSGVEVNIPRWKALARLAQQYGLRLFPIYTFAGTAEIRVWRGSFTPYVTPGGTPLERTPCPLDAEYWEQAVAARWEALALLSTQMPLAGILLDTEMYGGDLAVYEQPCLCDQCWQDFVFELAAANSEPAITLELSHIPADQRDFTLKSLRLWPSYTEIQEQRLQRLAAQVERRIHRINPALMPGIVAYVDNWFYRGLIRGLGTPSQPMFVFSETFYIRGDSPEVHTEQARIKEDGAARYVPGLWQGRFFPGDLPAQASRLAQQADGYWFFTADSLWTDEPKSGHYALHGTPAEYWAAWKAANAAVPAEDDEQSSPSVYDQKTERLHTSPRLKALLRDMAEQPSLLSKGADHIVYEEQTLFHFLPTLRGVIRVTLATPAAPVDYRLFDEAGRLAQAGVCSDSIPITLPSDASGVMSLLISPQKQGIRVTFGDMFWMVEASVTFPLVTRVSPLTLRYAVLPDQAHIRFKITSGTLEPTTLSVISPDGVERHQLQFHDFGEICLAIDNATEQRRQEFWKMLVNAPDSTTIRWHYFYQTPLPYVMP